MVKQETVVPKTVVALDSVRLRKFYPTDRDSPIFEVILDDKIIFDVARSDDTNRSSEFEIALHESAAGLQITIEALNDIVRAAEELIREEEGSTSRRPEK
jgi:hypothetical protein